MRIQSLKLIRLIQINIILFRHTFTRPVIGSTSRGLRYLSYLNPWSYAANAEPRGVAIRKALENLGPIFVKFGQVLSTRRDLLPDDIADELAKLQDQVPPFPGAIAKKIIEEAFKKSIHTCFLTFDEKPLASASIAQVHAATLPSGDEVIVKVLRPNILNTLRNDLALMHTGAKLTHYFWRSGKRLRLTEIVLEFERTILDELDLMREAANASQLRRNFAGSTKMYVPQIYWPYVTSNVMVMERIYGVRISDLNTLKAANTDLKKLAENGVEIFFTQVLRDSFFHADMHPGNLFVDITDPSNPKYIGVDFGIVGSLNPFDQRYIAENLLAFFHRNYREVAILHVESGWVPAQTRIDQFEAAIRTVCEPIFERPLKDISFAQLLLRLFRTAERFNMEVQPQLILLQKTLFNIEGLGRELYPELDLWQTAQPFLERWVKKRRGAGALAKSLIKEFPNMLEKSIKSPGIFFDVMQHIHFQQRSENSNKTISNSLITKAKRRGFLWGMIFSILVGMALLAIQHWAR